MSESIDVPLLLSVLEQVMPALESDANTRRAKHLAKALADQIEGDREFGLTELADGIDEQSPETIRSFITAAEAALIETHAYQRQVETNRNRTASTLRRAVLEELAELDRKKKGESIWFLELKWRAGLSERQTRNALRDLFRIGAVEAEDPSLLCSETFSASRFRLTIIGHALLSS